MIDRMQLAELFRAATGAAITAEDLPAGALPRGLPVGLSAMFDDYDHHGFHGGSALVLGAILGRPPRTVVDYVAELVRSS